MSASSVIQRIKAATPLQMLQSCGGGEMIGFRSFRPDLRERIDDLTQMARARGGQKLLLDSAPIDEERGLVSCLHDRLSERDGSTGGLIELGKGEQKILVRDLVTKRFLSSARCSRLSAFAAKLEGRSRQPPRIEHDPDLLAALRSGFAGDEFAAAGRRRPRNVAQLVAALVFAQTFELATQPAQP